MPYRKYVQWVLLATLFFTTSLNAQEDTTSSIQLNEVVIKAFNQDKRIRQVAAAVVHIDKAILNRFNTSSVLSAINTAPGVRMEERSPGSYRFNIRGSALRSPFGVRNLKVYYNDIPITDPGGHTYLNQLGYYNFGSIEIIKGPANSMYGAGTGGALLIENLNGDESTGLQSEYTTGSYGAHNIYGAFTTGRTGITTRTSIQYQQSDGFRNHSEMNRTVYSWSGLFRMDSQRLLKTTFIYGDLFYETPGGLTQAEFNKDPRAARPATLSGPGAELANAHIRQRSFIAGASYNQKIRRIENTTVLYGMFTHLRNPNLQNYDRTWEPHAGARSTFKWKHQLNASLLTAIAGIEWQEGFTHVSINKNNRGNIDSLRSNDEINNRQSLVFAQLELDHHSWNFTIGASENYRRINFQRFHPSTTGKQKRIFEQEFAPRISLMKKFGSFNLYTTYAKGFSPPATAELVPTGGAINIELLPEKGNNFEAGIKGNIRRFYFDLNAFYFRLSNTIVQRRTPSGGDYFINAGSTKQRGIEAFISYPVLYFIPRIAESNFWYSHTFHRFHYDEFVQLNADHSGNRMPGTPTHTISTGVDLALKNGLHTSISYYGNSKMYLNDANDVAVNGYHLLGIRSGINQRWKNTRVKISAGIDNLLDKKYSLGYDFNAFGGRYFNAAPGRNYFASLMIAVDTKRK